MVRQNRFEYSGRKLSIADVRALERQLGCELPDDYRAFLLRHNGGTPAHNYFPRDRGEGEWWVDFFVAIDDGLATPSEEADYNTLAVALAAHGNIVPEGALIIGYAARDNPLLLFCKGPWRGKVYVKNLQELPFPPRGRWEKEPELGLHPVAPSFTEFLAMLRLPRVTPRLPRAPRSRGRRRNPPLALVLPVVPGSLRVVDLRRVAVREEGARL